MTHSVYHPQVGLRSFFGRPGQWFEDNDLDGDKNSIFHDVDGSVTGYKDTYVGRADNYLIKHPNCVNMSQWNGVICSGRYSQVQWRTQHVRFYTEVVYCKMPHYHPTLFFFLTLLHPLLLQVYIQTQGAPNLSLSINRDEYPTAPLVLRGINSQGALFQPILMMSKSYTLHWSGPAPREVVLSLINFDK